MTKPRFEFSLEKFLGYSADLAKNLETTPGVVGLVFLGSAAATWRADEWSDHDFFVISENGLAEGLRQNLTWLPRFEEVAIAVRETDHGLKVVYNDGQVLEFAVFEDRELEMAAANSFAVAVDKCNLQQRMEAIAARTPAPKAFAKPELADLKRDFELLLCQIIIGVGRARRGEILIAGEHVRNWAVNNLLGLIKLTEAPAAGAESQIDNLNRYRRFEKQHPALSQRVAEAIARPVEPAAQALLEIALDTCQPYLGATQLAQVEVIKNRLGWL